MADGWAIPHDTSRGGAARIGVHAYLLRLLYIYDCVYRLQIEKRREVCSRDLRCTQPRVLLGGVGSWKQAIEEYGRMYTSADVNVRM